MKAAVLKDFKQFSIEDIAAPECPDGGLLVEVNTCAICNADLKMIYEGHKALRYPRILGHEIAGVVRESESGLSPVKIGDRVQIAPGIVCNKCNFCQSGKTNHCRNIKIIGFNTDGGFCEYMAISNEGINSKIVNLIPDNLTFEEASLAEPLACCINCQEVTGYKNNDAVLIIGAGPIGCLNALLAHSAEAGKVIIADYLPERLVAAELTLADRFINASKESLKKEVLKETDDQGADCIILACSGEINIAALLELLRPGGTICLFSGLPIKKSKVNIDMNAIHYNEYRILGAYGNTARQNRKALDMMATGKIDAKWLISNSLPLPEIWRGIDLVKNKIGFKTIINMKG